MVVLQKEMSQGEPLAGVVTMHKAPMMRVSSSRTRAMFAKAKQGFVHLLMPRERFERVAGEITLGPVIGKVTDTSARILVEVNKPGKLKITLTPIPEPELVPSKSFGLLISRKEQGKVQTTAKATPPLHVLESNLQGGRPEVFHFENLTPGTRYMVRLENVQHGPTSFRTFPSEPGDGSLNVGVISCNKIFVTQQEIPPHSDLWIHLEKSIKSGKVDQLVHLGDQIYGDGDKIIDAGIKETMIDKWSDRFKSAEAMLKNVPPTEWEEKQESIIERYREVYRETWNHAPTAFCLANCPNLMIYDDHEVRDNWGDDKQDSDVDSLDFFIARCAWRANLEYQRQLHENVDFESLDSIKKDYHFHVIGGVGYIFLDIRGSRTFHRQKDDPKPYLGTQQWEDLEKCLNPGGLFDTVPVLLVCSPAPLVFLEPGFTCVLGKRVQRLEDFKGHWSAPEHVNEQTELCEMLWQWKSSAGSRGREVFVLGGDVHCGGHSRILKDNKVVFSQLTTSAIANRPLPKSAYYLLRAVGKLENLRKGYSFNHHHWTRSRNYGMLEICNVGSQSKDSPTISAQLIIGKSVRGITHAEKVMSSGTDGEYLCGCCYPMPM